MLIGHKIFSSATGQAPILESMEQYNRFSMITPEALKGKDSFSEVKYIQDGIPIGTKNGNPNPSPKLTNNTSFL